MTSDTDVRYMLIGPNLRGRDGGLFFFLRIFISIPLTAFGRKLVVSDTKRMYG